MKNKIILLAVVIIVVFSSCEQMFNTVVDYEVPHTPSLVLDFKYPRIYDHVIMDTFFYSSTERIVDSSILSLTNSMKVTGIEKAKSIDDASIFLYEDNVLKDSFSQNSIGAYESNFNSFTAGKNYRIIAKGGDYPDISAEQIMPSKPQIISDKLTANAKRFLEYGAIQDYNLIEIVIKDNGNTTDYYRLRFYSEDTTQTDLWMCKQVNDIIFDPEDTGEPINIDGETCFEDRLYFKDETFNGQEKKVVVYLPAHFGNSGLGIKLHYVVENLSEAAYKYEKTLNTYWNNEGNPFAEPVILHSNVKEGYGIFALSNIVWGTVTD